MKSKIYHLLCFVIVFGLTHLVYSAPHQSQAKYESSCKMSRLTRVAGRRKGWRIPLSALPQGSIVYSVGLGDNPNFLAELIDETEARVYLFDSDTHVQNYINRIQELIQENQWAITFNGEDIYFFTPEGFKRFNYFTDIGIDQCSKSISKILKKLGHSHIDLLNINDEKAHNIIVCMIRENIFPRIVCVRSSHIKYSSVVFLSRIGYQEISRNGDFLTLMLPDDL